MTNLDRIFKSRDITLPTKICIVKAMGFSSSHVWMWELDCEESWVLKNWCLWTVVLEKTLESPLDCKEIQPVHSEGDQPWDFFGRNEKKLVSAKAETPVLWPPHVESWLIGKDSDAGRDWGQEDKGTIEDDMAGWHHWLDGCESEWTPGVGDGKGGLACCDSWGRRVGHDWATELNWTVQLSSGVRVQRDMLSQTSAEVAKTPDFLALMALTCCLGQRPSSGTSSQGWNLPPVGHPWPQLAKA